MYYITYKYNWNFRNLFSLSAKKSVFHRKWIFINLHACPHLAKFWHIGSQFVWKPYSRNCIAFYINWKKKCVIPNVCPNYNKFCEMKFNWSIDSIYTYFYRYVLYENSICIFLSYYVYLLFLKSIICDFFLSVFIIVSVFHAFWVIMPSRVTLPASNGWQNGSAIYGIRVFGANILNMERFKSYWTN